MTIKLTNGRVHLEVGDERQAVNMQLLGYFREIEEVPVQIEAVPEVPKPRRGRPPKKAS